VIELNRTDLRYRTLEAVREGNLTALVYLSLTPQASKTVDRFEHLGLIEFGERAYRLTPQGDELLQQWRAAGGGSDG